MNFIQVDEWKRRILHLVKEKKKLKSRRFTSYEKVTRLHLQMLQNWFSWQPVVPEQLGEVIHSPNGTRVSEHPAATKVQDYVMNSEQNQLIAKWLCPIWQVQIEIMRNDGDV
jgi:hypothetical protein